MEGPHLCGFDSHDRKSRYVTTDTKQQPSTKLRCLTFRAQILDPLSTLIAKAHNLVDRATQMTRKRAKTQYERP
jgi:hypothetical protein